MERSTRFPVEDSAVCACLLIDLQRGRLAGGLGGGPCDWPASGELLFLPLVRSKYSDWQLEHRQG